MPRNKKLLLNEYERYELYTHLKANSVTLWRNIPQRDLDNSTGEAELKRFCPYGREGEVINGYIKYHPGKDPFRLRIDKIEVMERIGMRCWAYRLTLTEVEEETK